MLASDITDGKAPRARIRRLPDAVAARIAAGEVIERPASIVKELLENALDAGATTIEVEIAAGGVDLIRIRDNGHGIPPDEIADAFERHATSKLRDDADLAAVRTLGFRGEALSAVAAAAAVDCTSRIAGEQAAATARLRRGALVGQGSAASAPGTTVEVRDLFAEQPARRRFLASERAEARACTAVLTDYALAYPGVAWRLTSNARTVLHAPGDGDPRSAAGAVYGADVARQLLALAPGTTAADPGTGETAHDAPGAEAGPTVTVGGLVGPPALHRGNRRAMHLFVNGRAVENRALRAAVEQGYAGLLPGGRHPLVVLHIDLPPDQVDVNVHPRKAEVRFRHERFVFAAVRRAVIAALNSAPIARDTEGAPGGWLEAPAAPRGAGAGYASARAARRVAEAQPALRWRPAGTDGRHPPGGTAMPNTPTTSDAVSGGTVPNGTVPNGTVPNGTVPNDAVPSRGVGAWPPGDAGGERPDRLPPLRPLGQVQRTFLVAEGPDGLYLIDQHAAHERVLYDRLAAQRMAAQPARQPLLESAVVTLTPDRAALLAAEGEALRALGWEFDPADGSAVLLRAVPQVIAGRDAAGALTDLLDRMEAEERLTGPERVIATQACRAAVMAGDPLSEEAQRQLLDDLARTAQPQTCPHGRPTTLRIGEAALRRAFGR